MMTDHEGGPLRSPYASIRIGPEIGLISDPTFALIDRANGELAERIWLQIQDGGGLDAIIDLLSMIGVSNLGDLALGQIEDGEMRFVVRGRGLAYVGIGDDLVRFDGGGKRTWTEETVADCTDFVLTIDDVDDEIDETPMPFRARSALLPAAAIRWPADGALSLADVDVASAGSVAVPVVAIEHRSVAPVSAVHRTTVQPVEEQPGPSVSDLDSGPPQPAHPQPVPPQPVPPQPVPPQPVASEPVPPQPVASEPTGTALTPERTRPSTVERPPVLTPAVPARPDVAGIRSRSASTGAVAPPPVGQATPADPHDAYADSVPTDDPERSQPGADRASDLLGDHDGMTMSLHQLRALRAAHAAPAAESAASAAPLTDRPGTASIVALVCEAGHANPPEATTCHECDRVLEQNLVTVCRPSLGRLELSTGETVDLDRPAVVGRNPRADWSAAAADPPQLVRIEAGHALSRSHVEIRFEGWQVQLVDLGSANGTIVTAPGSSARRLRAGETITLEDGSEIDLGGEVLATFEARSG